MQDDQRGGEHEGTGLEPVAPGSPSGFTVAKLSFINNSRSGGACFIAALTEESCTIDMDCAK